MTKQALVLVLALVSAVAAIRVEPIWISPKNSSQLDKPSILESFVPEKGVWADVPNGIGARGGPSVHFDSKGIIWIVGGSYGEGTFLNAGWNYNLDLDQYRWVAGQAQSTSRYQNLGTKGIEGPDVFPGYLGDASTSVIDSKDQIWIYAENSLFRWNTTNGYFTFLEGDPSSVLAPSVPGTPGEPSPDVWPGGIDSACMVLDSHDNFWLLGGMVSSNGKNFVSNAVWHYNTTSGYWTFVYGNTTGSVDNNFAENIFGGRTQFACEIDESDRIWVYGGFKFDDLGYFYAMGDLWAFNTSTWTWTAIMPEDLNTKPIIDVRNEFSPNNRPGSRYNHRLINRLDGSLMMVGGYQSADTYILYYDDVWLFNLTTYEWKIVFGAENLTVATNLEHTNYRTPGSVLGYRGLYGVARGKTNKGQFLIFGGVTAETRVKDMWIIPRDLCSLGQGGCMAEATCLIENEWRNACVCPDGLVGDGKTSCDTPAPVATPISDAPVASPVLTPVKPPTQKTSDAMRLTCLLSLISITISLL